MQTGILIDRRLSCFPGCLPPDSFLRLFKVHIGVMVKISKALSWWLWPGLYNGRAGSTNRKQDVGCEVASLFPAPLLVCVFIGQPPFRSVERQISRGLHASVLEESDQSSCVLWKKTAKHLCSDRNPPTMWACVFPRRETEDEGQSGFPHLIPQRLCQITLLYPGTIRKSLNLITKIAAE